MAREKILMTQEEYEELLQERKEIEEILEANRQDISSARGQGDLSENADYKAAREEQAKLETRRHELDYKLKHAEIGEASDENNFDKDVTVKFLNDDFTATYHITGELGGDPLNGIISKDSPLGEAIFKAKKGQKVTVLTEDNDRFDVLVVDIKTPKKESKKHNEK